MTTNNGGICSDFKGEIMKLIIMVVCAVMLAGCHGQVRTGSICIEPFTTTGFRTSNPIVIKQDVVDVLRDQIPYHFKPSIERETLLKVVSDCANADYSISGRLHTVDTSTQGNNALSQFISLGAMSSVSTFGLGIQGVVKNNKTSEIISTFDTYKQFGTLENTIWALSRVIIADIKYDNSKEALK